MQRIISPKTVGDAAWGNGEERVWLLPQDGTLFKVNLHTHSTLSDGSFSPEQLKRMYQEQGYSAVAFTDHNCCVPHAELTDERFVALTGTEIGFSEKDESGYVRKVVHINALAKDESARMTLPANRWITTG